MRNYILVGVQNLFSSVQIKVVQLDEKLGVVDLLGRGGVGDREGAWCE